MSQEVTSRAEVTPSEETDPGAAAAPAVATADQDAQNAAVREAQFASLSAGAEAAGGPSIDMIMDLEVDVCAELGRTAMLVRDLMELHPGSIVELRKVAGEPVDLLANGKLIARGEVVVVDETFGVRVTEIVSRGARFGGAS
jgi:flagellar motor switch protein FliN/FliY